MEETGKTFTVVSLCMTTLGAKGGFSWFVESIVNINRKIESEAGHKESGCLVSDDVTGRKAKLCSGRASPAVYVFVQKLVYWQHEIG